MSHYQTSIYDFLFTEIKLYPPIKMFEAFSGIGTQAMALKRLNVPYEIVGYSEIDKFAIESYKAIHGEDIKNYGNIKEMTTIPTCDIFTWSFPCTDLSLAGKQRGMTENTSSGLVYDVLRLVKNTHNKPKVLIMENVPMLISKKFSEQFNEIRREFSKMGYTNFVETLNSKDFGVAQNRNRVFMVSILGDYTYTFPKPFKLEKKLKDYLDEEVEEKFYLTKKQLSWLKKTKYEKAARVKNIDDQYAYTIDTMRGGNREPKIAYPIRSREFAHEKQKFKDISPALCARDYKDAKVVLEFKKNYSKRSLKDIQKNIVNTNEIAKTLTAQNQRPTINSATLPVIHIPEKTKKGFAEATSGDGIYISRPSQKRGVVQKNMIQTIKTRSSDLGVVTEDYRIRKLTPKECWRLMGCIDSDFEKAAKVCSNSQLYKQAGNAIVVDVFEKILRGMIAT